MALIRYSESPAEGRLWEFVECFWSVIVDPAGDGAPSHCVLPDGCATLSFHLAPPVGMSLRPPSLAAFRAPAVPGEQSIGVRFRPGALARFNPDTISKLGACDYGVPRADQAYAIIEDTLDRMIKSADDPEERVNRIVSLILRSNGTIRVPELAEEVNLSERQLERLCKLTLQLSPKEFARTARLQAAVRRMILNPSSSLADTAAEVGFADQAHMGREFISLGQVSPSAYARSLETLHTSLLQPEF